MAKRNPTPSSRYSDALHATWMKAVKQGSLRLKIGLKQDAIALRFKLNSLRKSLIYEGDPLGELANPYRIMVLVSPSTGDYWCDIVKNDKSTDEILRMNGIEVEEAPPPPILAEMDKLDALLSSDEPIPESPYLRAKAERKKGPSS